MVVVCHVAVLRCIHAYFTGVMLPALPFSDLLPHTVYELTPGARAVAMVRESSAVSQTFFCPGPFGCSCTVVSPGSPSAAADAEALHWAAR